MKTEDYKNIESALERFWKKVNKQGPIPEHRPDLGNCWHWTAADNGRGYGSFGFNHKSYNAHRWIYTITKGPLPKTIQLDHLCRNPKCVNITHLEPVTAKVNTQRGLLPLMMLKKHRSKTHCKQGHELTEDNIYWRIRRGYKCRHCAECQRLYIRRKKAKPE